MALYNIEFHGYIRHVRFSYFVHQMANIYGVYDPVALIEIM